MSIESINLVTVYETNGVEESGLRSDRPKISVREHWNRRAFVVIEFGETKLTVCADDLIRAIQNAQNAHRY